MEILLVNWWFTIIWALIWFLWTFWIYSLQEKSKEKDKMIYYYSIVCDPSLRLRPFELGEVKVLLYKKTKNQVYLSDSSLTNWDIMKILKKYI